MGRNILAVYGKTMPYNLRKRPDPVLQSIAAALPWDVLYTIALFHSLLPRHDYKLRRRPQQVGAGS